MNDDEPNIVQKVMLDMGGYSAFARLTGDTQNGQAMRDIAAGTRLPSELTRRRIVKASRGRLTEADILAVCGVEPDDPRKLYGIHPMWDAEENDLRHWIWATAVAGARAQRKANQRRRLR